ncbi:MAG: aminopeptidase P family protein [Prevotella sp.]|uniref:aminopeptidase P family protein n=1 Tax=Prevotella sp. TaxID=59823 RepID=UPI0025F3D522|nr:aminopeptidase P family protein [Prevotella sp.]MCI7119132.1 aminopeptidase P family protein [Prevotella sp.]
MTTDNQTIAARLAALRDEMRREHLSAFIFPSSDPHNSEYVPPRWEGRKWISGFDGSAGTAVVTLHSAALWTDSRYFLAAEEQLAGTEFQLMRERMEGTPGIAEWIAAELSDADSTEIGVDGMCMTYADVSDLKTELKHNGGITVRTNLDILDRVWTDRPSVPLNPVRIQPLEYAGESCRDKLGRIRSSLLRRGAGGMLMTQLDDIAWTLNLRGTDVHCTPVFVAWLIVAEEVAVLYIKDEKLSPEVIDYLHTEGVAVDDYDNIIDALNSYDGYTLLIDPATTNYTLSQLRGNFNLVSAPSPVPEMKAVKNEVECNGFRKAMLRDGVAMVKFLKWLEEAVPRGGETELSVSAKLRQLRAEQPLFMDESFDTIAGYEEHGAIVHYEPSPESDVALRPEGFLLLDSGAQYLDGTTDITRTIQLGAVTDLHRRVYTLVLKGHLSLQNLCFPRGAAGTQLDAVARVAMWRDGMNFMHGTGHGVGSYLSVHEGPHQIRQEYRPAPMLEGMTVTDEPGLYLAGKFGVRIENTLLTVPYLTTEFGRFLRFEPLTLCPIDTRPIVVDMLSAEELAVLNAYHQMVYERLSPMLDAEHRAWLAAKTRNL